MSNEVEIAAIADPLERTIAAAEYVQRGADAVARVRAIRDAGIAELRKTMTQRAVAEALGVTPGLIAQIDGKTKETK